MLFISPWNKYFFMRQFDISGDHSLRDDTKQYSNQIKSINMGSDFAGIPNTVSKKKVSFNDSRLFPLKKRLRKIFYSIDSLLVFLWLYDWWKSNPLENYEVVQKQLQPCFLWKSLVMEQLNCSSIVVQIFTSELWYKQSIFF